jgi:Uma2 family endonuclease
MPAALHRRWSAAEVRQLIDEHPELILQPDVYVAPGDGGKRPPLQSPVTRLLLSVKVLSPGTVRDDRVTKRRAYQEGGVPEYWIVDPDPEPSNAGARG